MPNLVINAGPGCGKTHTLIDLYYYLRSSNTNNWRKRFQCTDEQEAIYQWCKANLPANPKTIYLAYNTSTRDKLKKKIHPDTKVNTCHGWGYSILTQKYGYLPLNYKRDEHLIQQITGRSLNQLKNRNDWYKASKYLEKIKEELLPVDLDTLSYLNQKYADLLKLKPTEELLPLIQQLKEKGRIFDRKVGIPYIDQVYGAIGSIKEPIFDLGLVDECQDLSAARLALCVKLCKNLVFCGDKHQAINAFNGADYYAFERITQICDHTLPLLESFRLPPNHAEKANRIHPTANIRSTPGKQPGGQSSCTFDQLPSLIRPIIHRQPAVICRYNAPLFRTATLLMKNSIPCHVSTSTFVDQLLSFHKRFKAESPKGLIRMLEDYIHDSQEEFDEDSPKSYAEQANLDKAECVIAIAEQCKHINDFSTVLNSYVNNKDVDSVTLSTVHRFKGEESREMFLLFPPMQSTLAKTPEQQAQEHNIEFVARTRTMQNETDVWQ